MVTVVRSFETSALREQFDLAVINIGKTTPEGRPWWVGVWAQARLFARALTVMLRRRSQIVHLHTCSGLTFWRDCVFLGLARMCRRKVVWHVHGARFDEFVQSTTGIRRALMDRAFALSDLVIVLGEHWRRKLQGLLPARAWAVVENGVPLPPAASRLDTRAVLFVGNLDGRKGEEDLIVATAMAVKQGFGARVKIAGDEGGPGHKQRLQNLIAQHGVGDRVELLGVITGADKTRAFENAYGFVLPSYAEGLPMALLEAMSYGLPVIVTDVGSIPEVVTDGVHGFVIKPGDVERLAECLLRVDRDPGLRERMGRAGRRTVEDGYTVEAMMRKIGRLYLELLNGRSTQNIT